MSRVFDGRSRGHKLSSQSKLQARNPQGIFSGVPGPIVGCEIRSPEENCCVTGSWKLFINDVRQSLLTAFIITFRKISRFSSVLHDQRLA